MEQADPNRLWYVFSQDKEMGPFKEVELRHRLITGNIPASAHAFTEGMADWRRLDEIEGLKELILQQSLSNSEELVKGVEKIPYNKKVTKFNKSKIFLGFSLAAFAIAIVGYFWDPMKEQDASKTEMASEKFPVVEGINDPFASKDWNELKNYRARTDIIGNGFVLAKDQIGEEFPILKGAVSQNVQSDEIEFKIYPVPGANLMPLPKVIQGRTSIVNGYFVIGPLSDRGASLSVGKYRLIAKAGPLYLGELTLNRGVLPEGPVLQQEEEKMASLRLQKIAELRVSLLQKVTTMSEILKDFEGLKAGAQTPGMTSPNDYAPKARLALEKFRDFRTAVKSSEGDLILWGANGLVFSQFVENIWAPMSTVFNEFPNPNPDRFAALNVKKLLNELTDIRSKLEKTKSEEITQRSLDLLNEDVIKKAFMNEESAAR